MKDRREIRRKMKVEKKAMHKLEAEQMKLRAEHEAHTGKKLSSKPLNLHRSVKVLQWTASKQLEERWMYALPGMPSGRDCRSFASLNEQHREFSLVAATECESDCVDTCEVICEPTPKVIVQKRIRPGGRVERLMKRLEAERVAEDVANAREFAIAVCQLRITRKMLREQKAGDV
ncbi:MAG: hypothetical protein J6B87_04775 [Clostridia bacterium]|nr:hypothetical protein [Clostridia bacterium]